MELHVYPSAEEAINALADFFVETVNKAIDNSGECNVVLSGGNSPKKLYQLLAASCKDKVNWRKIWFFFGDERNVPFTDKDNNGQMAKQSLFDPLNIDESKIFYINTALQPEAAAVDYAKKIIGHFGNNPIQFDLILLGLGDNAHTASLFPYTSVLHETKATVKEVFLEDQQVFRITLTAPLINLAHNIAFLVYGKDKAPAVQTVLEGKGDIENFPAQLIKPISGNLVWFVDKEAASALENTENNRH